MDDRPLGVDDEDFVPLEVFAQSSPAGSSVPGGPAHVAASGTSGSAVPASTLEVPPIDELWPEPKAPHADVADPPTQTTTAGLVEPNVPLSDDAPAEPDAEQPRLLPPIRPIEWPKPFPIAQPIPSLYLVTPDAVTVFEPTPPSPTEGEMPTPLGEPVRLWPESLLAAFPEAESAISEADPGPVPIDEPSMADAPLDTPHVVESSIPTEPTVQPPEQSTAETSTVDPASTPSRGVRRLDELDDLLRLAASRGASTLYLSPDTQPSIRIEGELEPLEGSAIVGADDIEALLFSLTLAYGNDGREVPAGEWRFDLSGVGRIRCVSFTDHRGPGALFRIVPAPPPSEAPSDLPLEIQSLALEHEGLVLVAGPRSSGKQALIGGLVRLIGRTRRAFVVTVEREVNAGGVAEPSFVSRREVRGGLDEMLSVARAALRENPDVLVLQEVRSAALMNLALDAAASGQLVIAGFTTPAAGRSIERIVELFPPDDRRRVQLLLAQHLRAVIGQVLVPMIGGGRAPAREVFFNTPSVASILTEVKVRQLPLAIEAGRAQGMASLNDALVELVRAGIVSPNDAYRSAPDKVGFADALRRHGVDPQFGNE